MFECRASEPFTSPSAGSVTDPALDEPAQPFLIVIGGPRDGDTLALESPGIEKTLGSGPDCHLRLEAGNVDYHHARIIWEEGRGVLLSDEGSRERTYVNGETIGAEHSLQDGDRICLGPPGAGGSVKLLARVPAPPPLPHGLIGDAEPDFVLADSLPQLESTAPLELSETEEPPAKDHDIFDVRTEEASSTKEPGPDAVPTLGTEKGVLDRAQAPPRAAAEPAAGTVSDTAPTGPIAVEVRRVGRADVTELPSIAPDRSREAPILPTPVTDAALQKLAQERGRRRLDRRVLMGGLALVVVVGLVLSRRFLPAGPPVLTAVIPPKVEPGGTLTLTGSNFESGTGHNTVYVGRVVAEVTAASDTQLAVTIPPALGPGPTDLPLSVETRGGRSNALFVRVRAAPKAMGLEPEVALPGEDVSLKGHDLTGKSVTVLVDGLRADIQEAQPTSVRFKVPEMRLVEGRTVSVSLQAGGESARPLSLILGKLPLVSELKPSKGPPGERVVINGRGFDPHPPGNVVTFGDEPALVLSASERELVVAAPFREASQTQYTFQVLVKAKGRVSSGSAAFTLLRLSSGIFMPRFFAAPVPTDPSCEHVFVSTELGPLLLLSQKDDAATTGERAAQVASGLNALFLEATSRSLKLEARDVPGPAVAVAGRPNALVRATAEDAAGYGHPWDAVMKEGQRTTPTELAQYWTALLQDFLTLFVQRERPTRVVEVSSRGKVLLYLFSEGERRSGPGVGVPMGLVSPPSFTLVKSLREMALLLPAKGDAAAAAALLGRWEGTMDEEGTGERRIRLEFRLQGARLVGSLTTTARQISMDIILEGASYERGVLAFSYSGGSGVRRFRGTIQGALITGTIHGGDGQEVGRFTLRYAG